MRTVRKVIFVAFLLFLFSSLVKSIFDYQEKLKFYENYRDEFEKEQKRNIELKTEVLKKGDIQEIEKTIRNRLNLLKPGEIAVIIPTPTPTISTATPTPAPNWQQWKQALFED